MPKPTFLIILIILLFPYNCPAFDDGDFQYWNIASVSWKINDNWRMKLDEEFRWGDDASNPYYRHSDLGATYSGMNDWLVLGINYRHIFEERSGDWKYENRPHFGATVKFNLGDFKLSDKSGLAYRNREGADNFWQYTNILTAVFPLKLTRLGIQPYMSEMIYVNLDEEELNRNKLTAGFSLKLLDNLTGELFYLWMRGKTGGKWKDSYVLGTKLNLSF